MIGDVLYVAKEKWTFGFQEYKGADDMYRHYGIDVGDNKIIHFLNYDINGNYISKVVISTREEFSCGYKIKKCYRTSYRYNKNEIVNRAFSMINNCLGKYEINNNCENFVKWCVTGSKSIDDENNYKKYLAMRLLKNELNILN